MSREEHSAKVKSSMDNYMRAKCDAFLQSLESKLMAQVSNMINSVKSEMYAEISDAASSIVSQSSSPYNDSEVSHICNDGSSDTTSFSLPKQQRKRIKRRECKDQKSKVEISQVHVPGFSGKVPDAFIYGCSKDTRSQAIKEHLVSKGIGVKSVTLKSHDEAKSSSFKVCVDTVDDFERLLSRKFIPKYVKVKEYIYYSDTRSVGRSRRNHDSRKSSYPNHLNDNVTVPLNTSDLMNSSVSCLSNYFADKLSTSSSVDSTVCMQHPSSSIHNDVNNLVPSTEIATASQPQRSHDLYEKCIKIDLSAYV